MNALEMIGVAVLVAGYGLGCFFGGWYCGEEYSKAELVDSGHAEYYLDEKGEKQWRIKEKP